MRCPQCHESNSRVVDTRTSRGGRAVRRRRECEACSSRFTTYESIEEQPLRVLKQDGSTEEFARSKLMRSITAACAKRNLSTDVIDALAEEVEDSLTRTAGLEVDTTRISEMIMARLKTLDRVAYIRYASVYRNFRDVDEFEDFVSEVRARQRIELRNRDQVELPLVAGESEGNGVEDRKES